MESIFAFLFVFIVTASPLAIAALDENKSKTNWALSVIVCVMLIGGIYAFTNIVEFASGGGHFSGTRPLTIVEAVYLLSQMLTTVGYGDITPAFAKGQVIVGCYVLCCLLLIADMVSGIASVVVQHVEKYSKHAAKRASGG